MYHLQNSSKNSEQGTTLKNPVPSFLMSVLRLCEPLFRVLENLGTRNAYGGVVVPRMQSLSCKFLRFYSSAVAALRNKMPVLSHSPPRLARRVDGECRHPAKARSGFCGRAVRSALAAVSRFRRHNSAASLSLRTTPPAPPLRAVVGTA